MDDFAYLGPTPDGSIVIEQRTKEMLIIGILFLVFAVMSLLSLLSTHLSGVIFLLVLFAGIICFLFALYSTSRFLKPAPLLKINRDGILNNATFYASGFHAWSEIEKVIAYKDSFGMKWLGLIPKNIDATLERLNPLKRLLITLIRTMTLGAKAPINIPQTTIGLPVEGLTKFISTNYQVDTQVY